MVPSSSMLIWRAGFFGQRADHRAALADHVADLLGVDLHREQARREAGDFGLGLAHRFLHLAQDVHARFLGLRQRDLHDFLGDALDLDVHLQRGDAVGRAGHLEVHVAQVIFVAQDVGQHREAVVFLDQAHGDAGHVRLHRHAGVHHRQAAAADRSHRRGAVRLGDFRDHADRVGELFLGRQARRPARAWPGGRGRFRGAWSSPCGRLRRWRREACCSGTGSGLRTRRPARRCAARRARCRAW